MGSSLIYKHEDLYYITLNLNMIALYVPRGIPQDGMNYAKCFDRIIVGSCLQTPGDVDTHLGLHGKIRSATG